MSEVFYQTIPARLPVPVQLNQLTMSTESISDVREKQTFYTTGDFYQWFGLNITYYNFFPSPGATRNSWISCVRNFVQNCTEIFVYIL